MWEFLSNGGRVGFAYYSPRHWIDHERGKKLAALVVGEGGEGEMVGVDAGALGLGLGQGLGPGLGQRQKPRQRRYHHDVEGLFHQV